MEKIDPVDGLTESGELTPTIPQLRRYPFFVSLSDRVLGKLQANLRERRYAAGEIVLRAGDYSDAAYYIAEGTATARLEPLAPPVNGASVKSAGLEEHLAHLFARRPLEQAVQRGSSSPTGAPVLSDLPAPPGPDATVTMESGDIFGEMGALSRYPVSADVVALTELRCLMIGTPALRMMLRQKDLADFKTAIDDRYRERSLRSHLRNVDLFADLDEELLGRIKDRAELLWFEPGETIAEEENGGDGLYLVRGGYVKVAVRAGATELVVTYLRKGDYAGEISLLLDEPWPFSLRALEHVEMVKIAREEFFEVVAARPEVERLLRDSARRRLEARETARRNPLSSETLQMAMDSGLVHGESVLLIDLNSCTRCDDCVRACADTHDGVPRLIREGPRFHDWLVPTACYQCTDPVCMIGCPTGAITRPLGTLEVTIQPSVCIGCHNCVKRCPWDNIVEVPYNSPTLKKDIQLPTKCDHCFDRPQGPACVEACPQASAVRISFKDLETLEPKLSQK